MTPGSSPDQGLADHDLPDHERHNREFWDADADDYQAAHAVQLGRPCVWGVWSIPESDVGAIGAVDGLDALEYGCGGAQWAVALAGAGARVTALDQSRAQLRHAAKNVANAGADVALVCASGEDVPLADGTFDLVFCDHGAMSFCDPERSVPEVARLLRPDGRLVFNKATLLHYLCWDDAKERQSRRLHASYFDARRWDEAEGTVDFQLPYGEWIRTFGRAGLVLEDLIELQAPKGADTTYDGFADRSWSRRWPSEEIWVLRKRARAAGEDREADQG